MMSFIFYLKIVTEATLKPVFPTERLKLVYIWNGHCKLTEDMYILLTMPNQFQKILPNILNYRISNSLLYKK